MTRARIQRSFPLAIMHQHALFCKIPRSFNKLTNITLGSHFTLLHDQNFIHWTPNLAILTTKTFDCFKSLQRTQTPFQNSRIRRFGRWHYPKYIVADFCIFRKKAQHSFSKRGRRRGGQRTFGDFLKIHPNLLIQSQSLSPVGHNTWWETSQSGSFGPRNNPKYKFGQ